MLDKIQRFAMEAEGAALFLLMALNLIAAPVTYAVLMTSATDWTWYNLLPRIVGYAFASAGWIFFWPFTTLFG